MGNEIFDLMRFQHQNGGFYDKEREANARDTLRAVWICAMYGAFPRIDARQCFRWIQTLHNRDGGASMVPGSKSSVYGTYCFFHMAVLITPELVDGVRTIEFLKSCYDSASGLFKNTPDSETSIEATYYAYELLSRFRDADLGWLNTFSIRNYISDHLSEDHFEFEGVTPLKAQLYGGSISKYISLTLPYSRVSQFILNKAQQLSKEGKLDNEEAAAAANVLYLLGEEKFTPALINTLKTSGSLSDLFFVNQILISTGEISKFFELKVLCIGLDQSVTDLDNDDVKVSQTIRSAVTISSLGRFVNPLLKVNVTTIMGEEAPITESLQMDYQTGIFSSQRDLHVSKLGQISFQVVAWLPNEMGAPLVVSKSVLSHVSLPIEVNVEASLQADEVIPVGGNILPGTTIRARVDNKLEESLEIEESTHVTFQITDSAGTHLYSQNKDFKDQLEFSWQMPSLALPAGNIKVIVEVGDKTNGIHTRKTYAYKTVSEMAAINVEVPKDLKLSDVLHVKMTPAIYSDGEYIILHDEKFIEGQITDASGEKINPLTASETQHYSMRIIVGNSVAKVIEGEVHVDSDKKLYVEFESNVDENLDFATGFYVDFLYNADGQQIILKKESENFVKVDTKIAVEGEEIKSGKIQYGSKISTKFTIIDKDTGKPLSAGHAYPVIVVMNTEGKVILEKKAKFDDDKYSAKLRITASLPPGKAIAAIMIHKGQTYVPVETKDGKKFESEILISGELNLQSRIKEASKYLIVDIKTLINDKKLHGTQYACKLINTKNDEVVAKVPLAQKGKGSRLSFLTGNAKEYKIEVFRINDEKEVPLLVQNIAIEKTIVSFIQHLPIEGCSIIFAFIIF